MNTFYICFHRSLNKYLSASKLEFSYLRISIRSSYVNLASSNLNQENTFQNRLEVFQHELAAMMILAATAAVETLARSPGLLLLTPYDLTATFCTNLAKPLSISQLRDEPGANNFGQLLRYPLVH